MLIDLIVGSALLLFGLYCYFWLRSPALRDRIERPKHVFLEQAQSWDNNNQAASDKSNGSTH
jgi:hypothetical protein